MKRNIYQFRDEDICPYCNEEAPEKKLSGLYDPGDYVTIKCPFCKKTYELVVFDIIYKYRSYQLIGKEPKEEIECPGQLFFDFLEKK